MTNKEGKAAYEQSQEYTMEFMFQFWPYVKKYWRDTTEETPGLGRLINHSKCHKDVSMDASVHALKV